MALKSSMRGKRVFCVVFTGVFSHCEIWKVLPEEQENMEGASME